MMKHVCFWSFNLMLVYSFAFDVVRKGYLLAYDKFLKITVTQLYKVYMVRISLHTNVMLKRSF